MNQRDGRKRNFTLTHVLDLFVTLKVKLLSFAGEPGEGT